MQLDASQSNIGRTGRCQVGTVLQVTRVLCWLAIDQSWIGGADDVAVLGCCRGEQQLFHWAGEFVELDGIANDVASLLAGERFEVTDEVARRGQVGFGLFIQSAMNGIVGTLKQAVFAVFNELVAWSFRDS